MSIIDGPDNVPLVIETHRNCPCCESPYGEHFYEVGAGHRKCRHCGGEGKVENCRHCGGRGEIFGIVRQAMLECPECHGEGYHACDLRCDAVDKRDED